MVAEWVPGLGLLKGLQRWSEAPHLYNRKYLFSAGADSEWPRLARCQEFIACSIAISNFLYSLRTDVLVERLRTLAK